MKAKLIGTVAADEHLKHRVAYRASEIDRFKYQSSWAEVEQVEAEAVRMALTVLYVGTVYPISYRQKFMSIKVDGTPKDRAALQSYEKGMGPRVTKVQTPQGVIYRVHK